jgi:hypothetical protein
MKKWLFLSTAFWFLGTSAFASIGTTQCESDDGTLVRSEQEIWGANPVTWTHNGKIVQAHFIEGTRKVLSCDEEGMYLRTIFSQDVAVNGLANAINVNCSTFELPGAID